MVNILALKHGAGKCQSRNVYKTINAENSHCFQTEKFHTLFLMCCRFIRNFHILLLYICRSFSSSVLSFSFDFRSVSLRTINFYDLQIFPQKIHLNDRLPVNIWQGVIL